MPVVMVVMVVMVAPYQAAQAPAALPARVRELELGETGAQEVLLALHSECLVVVLHRQAELVHQVRRVHQVAKEALV